MRKNKYLSLSLVTVSAAAIGFVVISACTDGQAKAKPNIITKEAPQAGAVAKIGGEIITEDQLIGDDKLDFFDLKKREYELKMDRLNKLMVEKLIGGEAKKNNMSLDDFVNKKVIGGEVKISDSEYNKFVKEKHVPESQLNPQLKERIIAYLQSLKKQDLVQNYLTKLTKSNPVEVYFQKPKMNVNVDPGNSPWFGGEHAPVTIVEFSDFQCPFCSRAAETVTELKKKYGNKIKLHFRMFPLPMHKDARPSAEAALCVNDQGMPKFWKFHDLLFKNQDKLTPENFAKWAKEAGADEAKFKSCFDGHQFAKVVQSDTEYGEKIGVKSTPTFFINGQLVNGALPLDQFSEIVDDELASKKE
ncbi:MAG: DsbA family protein [Oligoflexia bacterium]|nr:DsbA family protein [Oligoflexia bacterium]